MISVKLYHISVPKASRLQRYTSTEIFCYPGNFHLKSLKKPDTMDTVADPKFYKKVIIMSELRLSTRKLPMCALGESEAVPAILSLLNIQQAQKSDLDDDDGLYVGYGYVKNNFPYFAQSLYDCKPKERELQTVVLENQYLRAEFLPQLGGRLWSLYDKMAQRDLVLTNDKLVFRNLAIRNAWFAGGVEWNMGIIGHSPFTCSAVHTALLHTDDGTPVLRIYEYERIRRCTYHVDFWLPENSPRLFAGVSIHNPNETVTPMYWWSNIAVPELPEGRVIVPADAAYTTKGGVVVKETEFRHDGIDITYPVQTEIPKDYFWKTRDAKDKYVCHVGKDGYGLCQASTGRQLGRKLFVWGQTNVSKRWNSLLETGGPTGRYVEIQAGLGQTQYECIPMPPKTTWRWVESYGAIQLDPQIAHGEYAHAVSAASGIVSQYELENVLENATHMKEKAETVLFSGSVWGGLENCKRQLSRRPPVNAILDFPQERSFWNTLLEEGTVGLHDPALPPASWMLDEDFTALLENAVANKDKENWFAWLQLGAVYFIEDKIPQAQNALLRSLELEETPWAHYILSVLKYQQCCIDESLSCAAKALTLCRNRVDLAKNLLILFILAERYADALAVIEGLEENVRNNGRILLYTARALLEADRIAEAEDIMHHHREEMLTTIREGEAFASRLYRLLLEKKGLPQDQIPWEWDFGK